MRPAANKQQYNLEKHVTFQHNLDLNNNYLRPRQLAPQAPDNSKEL
jgi:hypothetical protein